MARIDEYINSVKRVAEPAAAIASGAVAEPFAGWAGILGGGDTAADKVFKKAP